MIDFFDLKPEHFPMASQRYLPLETILHFKVLPLGTKRIWRWFRETKRLNVGLVNPNKATRRALKSYLKHHPEIGAIRFFKIDPEPFRKVLNLVYGTTPQEV